MTDTARRPSPNQAAARLGNERRDTICKFIAEFVNRERVAPSRAELAAELGVTSKAVEKHVNILIADDVLEDMGGSRGLRLAE